MLGSHVVQSSIFGRGRGLCAATDLPAGAAIVCEVALASASIWHESSNPWAVASNLAIAVVDACAVGATYDLEPRDDSSQIVPNDETEQMNAAADAVARTCSLDRAEARRLLHRVARNSVMLCSLQALCPLVAMINHSCSPNACHLGYRRTSDNRLCCCIRAVRPITKGTEIVISYVADLASGCEDRSSLLAHHGFMAEDRGACDAALVAWNIAQGGGERRAALEQAIGACNVAADAAWLQAQEGGTSVNDANRRQPLMMAAQHYAKLLQLATGHLGDGHALLLQARSRLAHIMTMSGVPRSRANALPLWKAVLATTRTCVPPNWPALLEPLRGIADAAEAAGDAQSLRVAREELEQVLCVLNPTCTDVRDS